MTEPQNTADAPTPTETTPDAETAVNDAHSPGNEQPETFSRAYVDKLRTEAAELRVRTGRLDEYETRLFDAVVRDEVRDLLRDPNDFQPADRAALLDDVGYPDRDAIRAAAEELLASRPHLGRVRGDAGQGARTDAAETFSLGAALRLGL